MSKLLSQLQRLYFLPGQGWQGAGTAGLTPELLDRSVAGEARLAFDTLSPQGRTRTLVVDFFRPGDWETVAALWQGVQEDLDLPAPAVSVSGKGGYGVWFSLAEAVPLESARAFLAGLAGSYLAPLPPARMRLCPNPGDSLVGLVPALDPDSGKWSAFIDPAMGSMFRDEPGLEMAPGLDKQGDILAGFASIKAGDFQRVLEGFQAPPQSFEAPAPTPVEYPGKAPETLQVAGGFNDPKSFLLAVMNDPSASSGLRVEAAKALLPYFPS